MRAMKTLTAPSNKPIGRECVCRHCGHKWHARVAGRDPICCPKHCEMQWYWNVDPKLLPESKTKQRKNRRAS